MLAAPGPGTIGRVSSVRSRPFRALWMSSACANLGDGLMVAGLPLLAAARFRDPGAVGAVGACWAAGWPVAALPAGTLLDRFPRARLIRTADALRGAALAALVTALGLDSLTLPLLCALAFAVSVGQVVHDLGAGSLVPAIVGREDYDRANSRLFGTETTLNEFVGPPLAGVLFGAGATLVFASATGAFLMAAGLLLLVPSRARPTAPPERSSAWREASAGVRFVIRHPVLRRISALVAVNAAAWDAWAALFVLYAVAPGPLGLSSAGYGVLLALLGAGGLIGAIVAPALTSRIGPARVLAIGALGTVVFLVTPALAVATPPVALAIVIAGVGSGTWNVLVASLRQRVIPEPMLGRATAAARLMGWGPRPLGAAAAGGLAAATDVRTAMAVIGLASLLNTALLWPGLARAFAADPEAVPERAAA
jgi:Transmembrane secretion effector